ncbi:malectin-A-like, partial [Ctenocephalides felis]|uniref:malectin-A-like n=1 Tax=Ctenocephalides felis TaxID=7515 RepID=UPI000E6E3026
EYIIIFTYIFFNSCAKCDSEIIYAVNAGGETHVDKNGIRYEKDPLMNKIGTASDYGKQLLMIGRVLQNDEILYQTERYHHDTFGYDIPIIQDGEYVLVLKFCEVYFNAPNMKVFDVVLNNAHTIVSELDIFDKVGRGVAHDEYIPFSVSRGKLYYNEEESYIRGGRLKLEFIKGYRDNPKINAFYLIKGTLDDVDKLPPVNSDGDVKDVDDSEQTDDEDFDSEEFVSEPLRKTSGPKQPDPYASDETSVLLPVVIAIGAFIPVLLLLCKM